MTGILQFVVVLVAGGAGALLAEWFRRRRSKTRVILLIERVNRNPLSYEPKGIKLVRESSSGGEPVEIKNLRRYELTLRNTSRLFLRNAEIQFDFGSEDVEHWVSRPAQSNTALSPIAAKPEAPWKTALRWQIPQFPQGDTVEFSFQVVDPATEEYEAALYSSENVVLKRTRGEPPPQKASRHFTDWLPIAGAAVVLVGVFLTVGLDMTGGQAFLDSILPTDGALVRRLSKEASIHEVQLLAVPKEFKASQLDQCCLTQDKGGQVPKNMVGLTQLLSKAGVHVGTEAKIEFFNVYKTNIVAGGYATISTDEMWYLPLYHDDGSRMTEFGSHQSRFGTYGLQKVGGKWFLESVPSFEVFDRLNYRSPLDEHGKPLVGDGPH
jgi:hypothetical protein